MVMTVGAVSAWPLCAVSSATSSSVQPPSESPIRSEAQVFCIGVPLENAARLTVRQTLVTVKTRCANRLPSWRSSSPQAGLDGEAGAIVLDSEGRAAHGAHHTEGRRRDP